MGISFLLNAETVQSVNLTYSRDAYIPSAVVVGDRMDIETTLFTKTDSFTDNIGLTAKWSGTATATQKNEDGTKADIYSRFSVEVDNAKWDTADNIGDITNPRVKEYREVTQKTLNYSGNEQTSANGWIEKSAGVWERSGKTAGLEARTSQGNIPYLHFQAGDRSKELTYKDNNKAYTGIVKGTARILVESGDFSEDEFIPFTVDTTDRFKYHKVYKSYRTNPSQTVVDTGVSRDDTAEAQKYANNIVTNNTVPTVDGTLVFTGSLLYLGIGLTIDTFVTKDGNIIPVGLAMIDISDNINAISEGGRQVTPDTTTVRLGRV